MALARHMETRARVRGSSVTGERLVRSRNGRDGPGNKCEGQEVSNSSEELEVPGNRRNGQVLPGNRRNGQAVPGIRRKGGREASGNKKHEQEVPGNKREMPGNRGEGKAVPGNKREEQEVPVNKREEQDVPGNGRKGHEATGNMSVGLQVPGIRRAVQAVPGNRVEERHKAAGNKREGLFKRKGMGLMDKRAIRHIEDDERRKASRSLKQLQVRGNILSQDDENSENKTPHQEITQTKDKMAVSRKEMQDQLKERLNQFKRNKMLLDLKKRREAKPVFKTAFKAGTYEDLNPLAPGAPLKPSLFSVKISSMNAESRPAKQNCPNKAGPAFIRSKQNLGVTSSIRVTRAGSKRQEVEKQAVTTNIVDQSTKSSSKSSVTLPRSFASSSSISAASSVSSSSTGSSASSSYATGYSASSSSSTCSSQSFAPPSFTFNFKMATPDAANLEPMPEVEESDIMISRAALNNLNSENLRLMMDKCLPRSWQI